MAKKPVVLIIRDGWGVNPGGAATAEQDGNAVELGNTPFHDEVLLKDFPRGYLSASGMDVGLPDGQMGNSEVGHLNLGAGRIVYQDLTRINKCIADDELGANEVLKEAFAKAKGKRLHFLGLLSDGGVHSHQDHLVALASEAKAAGVEDIFVHAITDGRDTSPTGGKGYLSEVEEKLAQSGARIATVIGRYYAMDRDKRWERTQLAWDAIVEGKGEQKSVLASEAVAEQYEGDKTDEFLMPMIFESANERRVNDGDVVVFFNFRADRARQLSEAFLKKDFDGFDTGGVPDVHFVTLTEYDETYGCPVAFPPQTLENVLGEVVAAAGKTQMRIAETEKYPHVTYFLSGGVETELKGEERQMVASPRDVATYDLKPEMSVFEITDKLTSALESGETDVALVNFANCDMVGHTGVFDAAVKAVEAVDQCLGKVLNSLDKVGGQALITADHGNSEQMLDYETGEPHTFHTTYPVPVVWYGPEVKGKTLREGGALCDLAPTVCKLAKISIPKEMTGQPLI